MSLDINRIVGVNISVSPLALQRAGYGILNIIGTSDVIPLNERIREYNNMDEVAADFTNPAMEEYKAAQIFFSQVPRPTTLMISRRNPTTATKAKLEGAYSLSSPGSYSTLDAANIDITIDGYVTSVTLDFSGATDEADVAGILQTTLNNASAGMTCVFVEEDGLEVVNRFEIQHGTAGSAKTLSFLTGTNADGIAAVALMKLGSTDGGSIIPGVDAEKINESLDAIEQVNSRWYGFAFTSEIRDQSQVAGQPKLDCLTAADWAEARTKLFCNNTNDQNSFGTYNASTTTSIAGLMKKAGYANSFTVYGDALDNPATISQYPAVSVFARGATVDFNAEDSAITYMFKNLPGISETVLSASQATGLASHNCNYFTSFGNQLANDSVAMYANGVMADGTFMDEVVGLAWLQNAIQTDVFNYLFQSPTKIPQTNEGVAGIVQVVEKDLEQAVRNGLAAPGQVSINNKTVFLNKGYRIVAGNTEDQSQADREARKAPPINFILKGAGAIHGVTVNGTFVR